MSEPDERAQRLAEQLAARRKARAAVTPGAALSRLRERTGLDARTLAVAALGVAAAILVLLDHPGAVAASDAAAAAPPQSLGLDFSQFPRTADGQSITWGELFDAYGLGDDVLQRSLTKTLGVPMSLREARNFRSRPIGRRAIVIQLEP